jgi:GNAT superfamily N-acetyltransferase
MRTLGVFPMKVEVRDITEDNVNDALDVCTPEKMLSNPSYRQGLKVRKEWLLSLIRTVGCCCKIAYTNKKPVGIIQFNPLHRIPYFVTKRRDILYIHCIFVKRESRSQGIGSKLLEALINDMKKPNPLFENQPCRVLVTTARERYAFKQPSYFRLKSFSEVKGNPDAGLVNWLFEKEPAESLGISSYGPIQMTEQGVTIFYDPCCQYCIYFNENIGKLVNELRSGISVREFNLWDEPQEALKRGVTSRVTYINGTPILFWDPEQFREAIRKALQA